jgi:hypothetical protein
MRMGMSALCSKELETDNIVPDYETLEIHPAVDDAYTRQIWHPGDLVAVWYTRLVSEEESRAAAQKNFPDFIWAWTPGGRVPVDLRHITWDGK